MAQGNKTCQTCGALGHSKFYCPKKVIKPIKKAPVKKVTKITNNKPKKPRVKSRSQLVRELDSLFSQYIRQKYAVDGMTACVTCGVVKRWQEQQNGHYMSRGHLPTRWSEDNCAPQCVGCNVFRKGNYTEYSLWMIQTYGADKLLELKLRANSGEKIPTTFIKDKIEYYKQTTN